MAKARPRQTKKPEPRDLPPVDVRPALVAMRQVAKDMAFTSGNPIAIYEHVGGANAKGAIAGQGRFIVRVTVQEDGTTAKAPPKHAWRLVETVQP